MAQSTPSSHGSHPSPLVVLAGLMVFTALEYVVSLIGGGLMLLLVIAFFKFLLVAIYFMHLPRLWTDRGETHGEQEGS